MRSSTVGLIFLILYFLYLDGSNWRNLIKLGLISTLEFQMNRCIRSHFWALVVDQYCRAKITLWTLQTIYNIPIKENLSTPWADTIKICGGPDYAAVYPGAIIKPTKVEPVNCSVTVASVGLTRARGRPARPSLGPQ